MTERFYRSSPNEGEARIPKFQESIDALKKEGWRSADDIGIRWGNIIGTRNFPKEHAYALDNDPDLVAEISKANGTVIKLFSPKAHIEIGEKLLRDARFAKSQAGIKEEIDLIKERYGLVD